MDVPWALGAGDHQLAVTSRCTLNESNRSCFIAYQYQLNTINATTLDLSMILAIIAMFIDSANEKLIFLKISLIE